MEISRWHLYVVVNCGLIIPFLLAKPFSLNKAIAEESLRKQESVTFVPIPDVTKERTAARYSLNNGLSVNTGTVKTPKFLDNIRIRNKKLASLKNKKSFYIKSPLKPKKLKFHEKLNLLHKRRNKSKKRDIYSNGKIDKKYIPLLRNLGVLFDNILHSESRESAKKKPNKLAKSKQNDKGNDLVCTCTNKSESRATKQKPLETAASVPKPRTKVTAKTTATAETPASQPYPAATVHVSSFRSDKGIPLLPTRNTTGLRRNHNGLGERSRAALHASIERDISGNHGDSEHDTGVGENRSSSTNNEEDTDSAARDDPSGNGPRRRIHGNGRDSGGTVHGGESKENESSESDNSIRHHRGNLDESKRKNKHEIGGDETENRKSISELGGPVQADEISENAVVQSQEDCEENISNAKHNSSNERLAVGDSPDTTEDQETGPTNEAVITIKDLSNPMLMLQHAPTNHSPQVTIIDGYSVARDKNGQNKLNEKQIRYQSQN